MKKILVCATFRDFTGDSNDEIQRMFLNSLKKQTYKNWVLIVTIFKEKNVENVLNNLEIPNKIFYSNGGDFRFSLSEVFENAIESIEGKGKNIILWTTCDVIFDDDFFEKIINNCKDGYCGTSHPHVIYEKKEDFIIKKNIKSTPASGIDSLFFDADLFLNNSYKKIITKYKFVDWGIFEHFLTAVGKISSSRMINLWNLSDISKICNDRSLNNENINFFNQSLNKNYPTFINFLHDFELSEDYLDLAYCNLQFSQLKKIKFYKKFTPFLILWIIESNIRKIVKNILPTSLHKYFKKKLV